MASILLQTNKIGRSVRYLGLEESRLSFKRYAKEARFFFNLAVFSMFFSPFFGMFFLFMVIVRTSTKLMGVFFKNEAYMRQYNAILQPQTANKVVSIIGYRVYDEELDGHLSIIKSGDLVSLKNKQDLMEHPQNKLRHVGIDMKTAKTHLALIGKTGAGKTECIRSITDDAMKNGSGILFNDGKSDVKMMNEFMIQAKNNNRETSVKVLNLLKAEKSSESNTFNFFANQHPIKLVEFLGSLAFTDSSDGNTAYFQNRGKALLLPIVSALYIRNQMLNEGLDSEKIRDGMQILNVGLTFITFYCICRDIDNYIASNKEVMNLIDDRSIITTETTFFNNIERLLSIIIYEPTARLEIEKKLGIEYAFIRESYTNVYTTLKSYVTSVWSRFEPLLMSVSLMVYAQGKKDDAKSFYDINKNPEKMYKIHEIRILYNKVKEVFTTSEKEEALDDDNELIKDMPIVIEAFARKSMNEKILKNTLIDAFKQRDGSLEKPPADAIQQHAYAQQQWEQLFNVFTAYKHIFAQPQSEINPIDVLRDNQILYVLLPPLELSRSQVQILGKIIIMTIKNFAGIALGGEFISIHQTIKNIAKDSFTPKPFTLINLDEYGAYPVGDIDTILAQVRSLNMSVVLGIQDFVSLKTSGSDETAQKRALANTTKIVFKISDRDVIEWLEAMVAEQEVEKNQYKRDASGELVLDTSTDLVREKVIPVRKTIDADNGFCLLLLGSESDRAIWLHTFFRGGTSGNTKLIHSKPIRGLKNDVITNLQKGFDEYLSMAS